MNNGYYGMDWGWGWGFPFMGIILFIFFLLLIVYLVRMISSGGETNTASSDSAIEILKQRYARGEIDETTYDEMLKRINK